MGLNGGGMESWDPNPGIQGQAGAVWSRSGHVGPVLGGQGPIQPVAWSCTTHLSHKAKKLNTTAINTSGPDHSLFGKNPP